MIPYLDYHRISMDIGDVDPSYSMLRYVCDRFELNMEQRFWLAFLYSTCYCGPTVYYIYNEFPDFENVDVGRLQRWWNKNKSKTLFQTDRRWLKSMNNFVPMFESYRDWVGPLTQEQRFNFLRGKDKFSTYETCYAEAKNIFQMGRFALFLYLESVHVVTGFQLQPSSMLMSEAESCRNGLAEAIERPDLNNHENKRRIKKEEMKFLQQEFDKLVAKMREDPRNNVWNIETTLCAYKKYRIGKRYIGYYLDRQAEEIETMEKLVTDGVDWSVLWQYRKETFQHKFLLEVEHDGNSYRRTGVWKDDIDEECDESTRRVEIL